MSTGLDPQGRLAMRFGRDSWTLRPGRGQFWQADWEWLGFNRNEVAEEQLSKLCSNRLQGRKAVLAS